MSDVYKGDTDKYTVWISTEPYNKNGNTFIHLCSDATFSYNLSYALSTYNVIGKSTDATIVTDSASGAVGNISVNGVRINPNCSTDPDVVLMSNADFHRKMIDLQTAIQMKNNAYVLRIFRADWKNTPQRYRDLYVFIYSCDMTVSWDRLNEMNVSLSFYRRNQGVGFGK